MSVFILKHTRDGVCLYLDNLDMDEFVKVAEAKKADVRREGTHVFLSDGVTENRTLYGIIHGEVFQVTLHKSSQVMFLNDHFRVCIFERDGQWCTMQLKQGSWEERVLGERHVIFLSYSDLRRAYSGATLDWNYFLRKKDDLIELSYFVKDKLVVLGSYLEVEEHGSRLIAIKKNGDYDVFLPYAESPLQGKDGERFRALGGVFIWFEPKKKWIFHESCVAWGKNAVFHTSGGGYGKHVELYRVEGEFIRLVAEGRWKWMKNASIMCIEGMKYSINYETDVVDFDNPKPTLWKKIKNFFKCK